MSSRIHKIAKKYENSRPQIDRSRTLMIHTHRAQQSAKVVAGIDRAIEGILSQLDSLSRKQLLVSAKGFGIKGRHTMTKPQLLTALKTEMKRSR